MNLVEAPDHAGPVAPPHAPERLRTLLAEGRDAQNDETAQSERAGFSPLKLNLDSYSESKDSNIFALGWSLWRGGSPSRGFLLSLNRLNLLPGMYVCRDSKRMLYLYQNKRGTKGLQPFCRFSVFARGAASVGPAASVGADGAAVLLVRHLVARASIATGPRRHAQHLAPS